MKYRNIILLLCLFHCALGYASKHWSLPYTGNIADQLELFFPDSVHATGQAVLICPGGGYRNLSYNEKELTARWLQSQGIMAVALSYRLPNGDCMAPLTDAWEAMRYIRAHAAEWHIDPHQVGVIGFSAGGHLAASLSVHHDMDTRPDFSVLFYPVITFHEPSGSRTQLCGEHPAKEQEDYFSAEDHVNVATPPAFFVMSSCDATVPACQSIAYVQQLLLHRVYTETHFYPEGKHGFCFKKEFPYYEEMTAALSRFLKAQQSQTPALYTHRVGTYNIRVATPKDTAAISWQVRKQYVAQLIREQQLDIVGLQEIKHSAQLHDLQALLPEYEFISWGRESADNDSTGEQVAIAYLKDKFRVEKADRFFLAPNPQQPEIGWDAKYPRVAVCADLLCYATNQKLCVCCTHLDNVGKVARQESMQLIADRFRKDAKYYPAIIMGDMNTKTDGDEEKLLSIIAPYFQDARSVSAEAPQGSIGTWAGWSPVPESNRRLDYLFVHDVRVLDCQVVHEDFDRGVTPSDHYPVVITIRY